MRPSHETVRLVEELRRRRDIAAKGLDLEPACIASRAALETIAMDRMRATSLLVPWQREVLGI
jgi:hypothetical protein